MREIPSRVNEIPEGRLVGSSERDGVRYRPISNNEKPHTENRRGYYSLPILKRPVWHWEVWLYFFLGGLAAGCYAVASLAELFGDRRDRPVARTGYLLSFLAVLACPILLIKDLGRPERFLNMLRVVKPESPMSMGVWGLVSFSAFATLAFIKAALSDARGPLGWFARLIPGRLLAVVGLPFAAFLGSYTGVLLSVTSVPIWARSRLLGATFLASAFSSAISAISLALGSDDATSLRKLESLDRLVVLAEGAALAGYLAQASRAARPLFNPREQGVPFLAGTLGLGLAVPLFANLSGRSRAGGSATALVALAGLVGGLCLRLALVEGGQPSSQDTDTYLWMTDRPVEAG